jgi:hypothetical protein
MFAPPRRNHKSKNPVRQHEGSDNRRIDRSPRILPDGAPFRTRRTIYRNQFAGVSNNRKEEAKGRTSFLKKRSKKPLLIARGDGTSAGNFGAARKGIKARRAAAQSRLTITKKLYNE